MIKFDIFILIIFIIIVIFSLKYKEHFVSLKENFIVADAQDINHYKALRKRVLEMPDNFDDDPVGHLGDTPHPHCNFYDPTLPIIKPAYLEDPNVRGYNYNEYSDFATPTQHIRIISQNTKGLPPNQMIYKNIPTGYNYAFHQTPAMRIN